MFWPSNSLLTSSIHFRFPGHHGGQPTNCGRGQDVRNMQKLLFNGPNTGNNSVRPVNICQFTNSFYLPQRNRSFLGPQNRNLFWDTLGSACTNESILIYTLYICMVYKGWPNKNLTDINYLSYVRASITKVGCFSTTLFILISKMSLILFLCKTYYDILLK